MEVGFVSAWGAVERGEAVAGELFMAWKLDGFWGVGLEGSFFYQGGCEVNFCYFHIDPGSLKVHINLIDVRI